MISSPSSILFILTNSQRGFNKNAPSPFKESGRDKGLDISRKTQTLHALEDDAKGQNPSFFIYI
ncbi:hypothetical protein CHCC20441_1984 [Bacillus licheniformis]|nr:hypothetical protein B4164_3771 [Bacillus licheniformis]TWN10870.1 hypothetical protein CHCC14564_3422 [Bacillus licheniformis LMG 17339]OLF97737.1 hypothetical protein B4094_1130 [Bacillus licheniformis]OLG04200.1 hypothetical protein B4124_2120 [Bacillus licheniformis]TWJ39330.1 hypothetical protein CHCC5026_1122 [Bacillus licheniformis]